MAYDQKYYISERAEPDPTIGRSEKVAVRSLAVPSPTPDGSEAERRVSHACSLALGYGASGRADVLADYQRERQSLIEWVELLQSAAAEVVQAYDECTGAEPSQSVLDRAIDVNLRKAAAGFDNFQASQQAKDEQEAVWGGWV